MDPILQQGFSDESGTAEEMGIEGKDDVSGFEKIGGRPAKRIDDGAVETEVSLAFGVRPAR